MYEQLPNSLKVNGVFCMWKYEMRNGKKSKVPYQANGYRAKSNDIDCFTTFYRAINAIDNFDGIGLGVFNEYSAVDIDHCVEDGRISTAAQDIIDTLQSYTELSPSGTGIRIIFKVSNIAFDKTKYYINNHNIGLEIYISGTTSKFVTLTGRALNNCDVKYCDDEIMLVLDKYMNCDSSTKCDTIATGSVLTDEQLLEKALNAKNADNFISLWNGNIPSGKSHSEADMALCSHLAFWSCKDAEQMDRLFRQSGLMRDKWDRTQSGSTYGNITIAKAIERASAIYGGHTYEFDFDDVDDIGTILADLDAYNKYRHNDNGTGRLFADVFKNCLRYVPQRKTWYYYNGVCWIEDVGGMCAMEKCKQLVLEMLRYSVELKDSQYTDYCNKLQSRNKRKTILDDAQSVYPISMSDFDSNKYMLNCNNGTLNLFTNEFNEHSSDDLITKLAPVDYDPSAYSKRFNDFLNEIMSGDMEKAKFLQKALGYSITGDTRYECMFFLYGATTRNGKGTLMESMLNVFGDYGKAVKPETIAEKFNKNSSTPSEDIARLKGVRLANISEPGRGMVLDAAGVKTMTGNDTINARFLHENSFDFRPQFKLYINTNYLPVVKDATLFSSNRLFIIPFDRHFEPSEQDNTLKSLFAEENTKSAILNWLIKGNTLLGIEGLKPPKAVLDATEQYNHDSDKMQLFAEECLDSKCTFEVRTSVVYSAYKDWCSANGMYAEGSRTFTQSLRTLGEVKRKRPNAGGEKTTMLIGFKVKDEFEPLIA